MPDKSKRRKNNKNKRKNKNNSYNKKNDNVKENVICDANDNNVNAGNDNPVQNLDDSKLTETTNTLLNENPGELDNEKSLSQVSSYDHSETVSFNEMFQDDDLAQSYIVESPEQSITIKPKICNKSKSKSLDSEEAPNIVEITEDINSQSEDDKTLAVIDSNALVSDVESDLEWEKTDELPDKQIITPQDLSSGKMTITSIPLTVAQYQQATSLSPEDEISLRQYLKTLELSTQPPNENCIEINTEIEEIINREIKHRLRKKGLADDFLSTRLGPPRILDVIDEESGESSISSRRQSYLNDKKSDNEELDDDVFEDKKSSNERFLTKFVKSANVKNYQRQIPQKCVLLGTKIKDPEISEARGGWTAKTVEEVSGAEVVYLTDSSSSTSSLYDNVDEVDEDIDTDASVRMITPTIEVTDTESLLKKTYISQDEEKIKPKSGIENIAPIISINSKDNECNIEPNPNEIVVLSTENIKTDLYVKELDETLQQNQGNKYNTPQNMKNDECLQKNKSKEEYDLEIKLLKCELNDAINNMIKGVNNDSEIISENNKELSRQDSSSSVCSSQCTAKYNPNYSSLNDVSNVLHDESNKIEKVTSNPQKVFDSSHVKDVFEYVAGKPTLNKYGLKLQPHSLRDFCVKKIVTLPFGEKILEELAAVSERLQNIAICSIKDQKNPIRSESQNSRKDHIYELDQIKMPYYPLPDLSLIEKVSLPTNKKEHGPPPVKPRVSSLKKGQDDHWTGLPTKNEPVYVCLSPSQKMLMEKTNTVISKEDASQLIDMHKKFVDRRGYNECYNKDNNYKNSQVKESPVVPFKSQTGSRLLALIRDPSVTNLNSNSENNSYSHRYKSLSDAELSFKQEQISPNKAFTNAFKPIPPPRPRKYSSTFYESDESSDFTDNSFRSFKSDKKYFHYSTGALNKEIENDISSIQSLHRNCSNVRENINGNNSPRRPSLPKDLCDQQLEYILQKEKEVEAEIRRLEQQKIERGGPRAPLISEKEYTEENITDDKNHSKLCRKEVYIRSDRVDSQDRSKLSSVFSSSQEEIKREKMYSEYVNQMAEREERKQHKLIKISNKSDISNKISKSTSALDILDSKVNNRIEKEFILKARERWNKLGIKDPETEDERDDRVRDVYVEPKAKQREIKVIKGAEETDVQKLPRHLQDFVRFTAKEKDNGTDSPGESASDNPSLHVVVWSAVIIIVLSIGRYFLRMLRTDH